MAYLKTANITDINNNSQDTTVTPYILSLYTWKTTGNDVANGLMGTTSDDDFIIVRNNYDIATIEDKVWTTSSLVSNIKYGEDGDTFTIRFPYTNISQFAFHQDSSGNLNIIWSDNNDATGSYRSHLKFKSNGDTVFNSAAANDSGMVFSNINSSTPTSTGQPLGIDSSGKVVTISASAASIAADNGLTLVNISGTDTIRLGGNLLQHTTVTQNNTGNTIQYNLKFNRYNPAVFSQYTFSVENTNSITGIELEGAAFYQKNNNASTPTESNSGVFRTSGGAAAIQRTNKKDIADTSVFAYMQNKVLYNRYEISGKENTNGDGEFMLYGNSTNATFNSYTSEYYIKDTLVSGGTVKKAGLLLDPSKLRIGYYDDFVASPSSFIGFEFTHLNATYVGYALKALNIPSFAGTAAATTAGYPTGYIFIDSSAGNVLKVK